MSVFATRIAKTAAVAVIAAGALGLAHSSTTAKPMDAHHVSAAGPALSATIALNPTNLGKQSATDDVTWGH
ncbi:hypothetical protein [Kitasatospora viridis]|uniref:Small secreted domain DUF320 n=1 Tax=Kitasatospora viridis TaxID=281105 RepID=A0A561UH07_9ACTN|nr:hypothetical protein [Kitasatospora viridis]TWF98650.1 hypothetical protein FHX73_112471 [Kitasatospora viridis]